MSTDFHEDSRPPREAARDLGLIEPAHIGEGLLINPLTGGIEYVPGYKGAAPIEGLRDIGELSYGTSRRIIGTDDRVQITQTNLYPWSAIVSLFIESPAGNGIGTGFFIGPKTIATCGHCVFIRPQSNPSAATWATRITVRPGRNDTAAPPGNLPFSSVVAPQSALMSVTGWTRDGANEYDYGVIKLNVELGRSTGWFGYGAYTDAQLMAMTANLSGYPGDKGGGTQWFAADAVTSVDARRVFYRTDMMPGHSGSPVFTASGQGRYAFAINAYQWSGDNFGTRLNAEVSAKLTSWQS